MENVHGKAISRQDVVGRQIERACSLRIRLGPVHVADADGLAQPRAIDVGVQLLDGRQLGAFIVGPLEADRDRARRPLLEGLDGGPMQLERVEARGRLGGACLCDACLQALG